ncbi:hypothetical protein C7405_101699 [Paraburkholderia caballeronis]|nr:hypothetical protein C7405_101699 [Paraburkholderia caballeronis]
MTEPEESWDEPEPEYFDEGYVDGWNTAIDAIGAK